MNPNKYWLYLEPFTFCFIKNKKALVYNSLSGEYFTCNMDRNIETIMNELLLPSNMYSILLTSSLMNDMYVRDFIKNIQKIMAGDILPETQEIDKPIIIFPKLNIYNDAKRFDSLTRHNILENLRQVTICLDYSTKSNLDRKYYNMQFDVQIAKRLLDEIAHFKWIEIIIDAGKDITRNLPAFNYLKDISLELNLKLTIEINDRSLENINILDLEKCMINILVYPDFDEKVLKEAVAQSQTFGNCFFTFHIATEDDYNRAESFCDEVELDGQYSLLYDRTNFHFFDKYLCLEEEEILLEKLNRKDIFRNQTLNTNDFGKLTIMPDGQIYANTYFPALGTLNDDIRELIFKELTEGQSWLRIRNMKPCSDCIYQWLCPSPSNYELATGKPNLCHVEP